MLLLQGGAAGTTFIMPSAEAWAQFEADAEKQSVNLTDAKLDAVFSYLITRVPISAQALQKGVSVPMNLAADKKALAGLCPKSTQKGQLVFAADTSNTLAATSDAGTANRAPAPRFNDGPNAAGPMAGPGMGPMPGGGAGMGMGGPNMGANSATLGAAPAGMGMGGPSTNNPNMGMGSVNNPSMGGPAMGGPAMGGPAMGGMGPAGGQPTMGVAPQRMGNSGPSIPGLGPLRRLMQALGGASSGPLTSSNQRTAQVQEPAASEEDPSAFSDLLLPTTYQAKVDSVSGGAGIAAASGRARYTFGYDASFTSFTSKGFDRSHFLLFLSLPWCRQIVQIKQHTDKRSLLTLMHAPSWKNLTVLICCFRFFPVYLRPHCSDGRPGAGVAGRPGYPRHQHNILL